MSFRHRTFVNSQTSPLLGIIIGQKPPYTQEATSRMIHCLEPTALNIGEPTNGSIMTQNYLVSARNITV